MFSVQDLNDLARCVADAWRAGVDRDWHARAGTLDWTCAQTADHAVDTLIAPAFFLASRRTDTYPAAGWSPGVEASPGAFVEGVEIGARILSAVAADTPGDVRSILFRNYGTTGSPADFPPRGALELILHAHDVCVGLGVDFDPPRDPCENLRRHVRDWPFWGDSWPPLTMAGDPWTDLLRSSGRVN